MNPRKKFKQRNTNSNSENECPSSPNTRSNRSTQKRSNPCPPQNNKSPCKKEQQNNGSPHKQSKRPQALSLSESSNSSPHTPHRSSPTNSRRSTPPRSRHPRNHQQQPMVSDFASPKLSYTSPSATEVPLPPTHWFSGNVMASGSCARELFSENTISAQLKTILNVM